MSLKRQQMMKAEMKNRPSLVDEVKSSQLASQNRQGRKRRFQKDASDDKFVDSKLTKKIIKVAQSQLLEEEGQSQLNPRQKPLLNSASGRGKADDSDDEDEYDSEENEEEEEEEIGELYDEENEEAHDLARHVYTEEGGPLGQLDAEQLRSLISEKRTELESELGSQLGSQLSTASALPDSLREHFLSCKSVLHQYRSGKLPKPIKQLPHFGAWQELVELLEPNNWTAAAMCAVTKYFSAKGKQPALQFYQYYLLPRCRDDIAEYRRLNFHLYSALKKAMFRQREFCCGLLLPWSRDAISLPEATILAGLLRRVSIPVKYAAPALHMLLQLPYSGGRAILVRTLLEKKYNLPDMVVGQAVRHFLRMQEEADASVTEDGRLPVLWHQALLALVERYGAYTSADERQQLLKLCRQHQHPDITPIIRQTIGALQQSEQMAAD